MEDGDTSLISEALKWTQPRDSVGPTLEGTVAAKHFKDLRAWAEKNQEIRIPHPKAALILRLLDRGMMVCARVPGTGKLVLRTKGAKQEFCRFIANLNRSYAHDAMTIRELLTFAYGLSSWESDPVLLQDYARGSDSVEIKTRGSGAVGCNGLLKGEPGEIESVLLRAFGC